MCTVAKIQLYLSYIETHMLCISCYESLGEFDVSLKAKDELQARGTWWNSKFKRHNYIFKYP